MRILIIDDDSTVSDTLERILTKQQHEVSHAINGKEGLEQASSKAYDLIFSDLQLPDIDGLDLIHALIQQCASTPVVLITGYGTNEIAIKAMQSGAYDYITKPFDIEELLECVGRVKTNLNAELKKGDDQEISYANSTPLQLVGTSKAMQKLSKEIGRLAQTDVTALITGETGTGKEIVARLIQAYSARKNAPFVTVNCSAFPENLIEAELFGHEKGAFTGATAKRIGRIEQANHGTLFLDEIGELDLNIQVKLLRFLQEKTIQRLGGNATISLDVRIISATNRSMAEAVSSGHFREDLYYRLNVALLEIPALTERPEDILPLMEHFNHRYAQEFSCKPVYLSDEAKLLLEQSQWPGNVRQLENVTRQLLIMSSSRHRNAKDVQEVMSLGLIDRSGSRLHDESELANMLFDRVRSKHDADLIAHLHELIEKTAYCKAIEVTQGHQTQASNLLGVSMKTLRDKLKKFGVHPKGKRTA